MLLNTRCNYAGVLGKTIPTRSFVFASALLARLAPRALVRFRR